jgi:hypothetical protein
MASSRREFLSETLGSLAAFSLVETFARHDLFAADVKPLTREWLAEVNQLSLEARQKKVQPLDWQSRVEALYEKADLADLLRSIDFDKLTTNLQFVDNGARSLKFSFRDEPGVPANLAFGKQIFALKKGCSVVPHGHNNMNTAFLVLKGELHGRHYDRLKDEPEHLIIRPTIDQKFRAGGHSSISDVKDNIHWFKAESDTAFIFNIHVMDVRPGSGAPTGRVYVDPQGEKLADGTIRAKLVGYKEVHQLYG